jgi:hypothetical protein
MATAIPFIMNGNGTISIMLDGNMKPVDTAHKNYEAIKEALKNKDWDVIPDLVNIAKEVEDAIATSQTASGKVFIKDGEVFYGSMVIQNTLSNRIVAMAKEGFDVGHMITFLENLMENPSYRAVNELYDFLEVGAIPITEKGTFLTYKKIKNDWTDIYSGKFDNSVGAVAEMPRNMVNEDSNQTCSAGLHVCSYDYLPHFASASNDRVVICEVNPADVVSIPTDYNNTKMRVCKYVVIGEVADYREHNTLSEKSVVYTEDVTSGKTAGTINHAVNNPTTTDSKEIGKNVTELLDISEISSDDLFEALVSNGVDRMTASEIQDIADEGDTVRVGKKVSKLVANNSLDAAGFMDDLGSGEEPERYDECPECGAENRWELEDEQTCAKCDYQNEEWLEWNEKQEARESAVSPAPTTPVDEDFECPTCGMKFDDQESADACCEEEEDDTCDRCGNDLEGESECPECGYWQA